MVITPSLWPVPDAYPLPGILNDQLIRFGKAPQHLALDPGGVILNSGRTGQMIVIHVIEPDFGA